MEQLSQHHYSIHLKPVDHLDTSVRIRGVIGEYNTNKVLWIDKILEDYKFDNESYKLFAGSCSILYEIAARSYASEEFYNNRRNNESKFCYIITALCELDNQSDDDFSSDTCKADVYIIQTNNRTDLYNNPYFKKIYNSSKYHNENGNFTGLILGTKDFRENDLISSNALNKVYHISITNTKSSSIELIEALPPVSSNNPEYARQVNILLNKDLIYNFSVTTTGDLRNNYDI